MTNQPIGGRTWLELHLAAPGAPADALAEMAAALVEARDATGAFLGSDGEWLVYFDEPHERDRTASALLELARDFLGPKSEKSGLRWRWGIQKEEPWATAWRDHFQPVAVAPNLRVVPPWRAGELAEFDGIEVVVEPGQGFGTGGHESTRLCLETLSRLGGGARIRGRVLDVGSGSGILAITAVKFGASAAVGVEIDPAGIENALRNTALNGIRDRVAFVRGGPESVGGGRFDFILCNMIYSEFAPMFPMLPRLLMDRGRLILSGFLNREEGDVKALLAPCGGAIEIMTRMGEWTSLVWGGSRPRSPAPA